MLGNIVDVAQKEAVAALQRALQNGNADEAGKAWQQVIDSISEKVKTDYEMYSTNQKVLAQRGYRMLTTEETEFYQKMIKAEKSSNAKQSFTDLIETQGGMPETIIEDVYRELTEEHPLLNRITFQNVKYLTRWILNDHTKQKAAWGEINGKIEQEITSAFKTIELTLYKLSAFAVIPKDMLDLGPSYLDNYIRTILKEALYVAMEKAIIAGSGKNEPTGMNRDIHKGVSFNSETGYPKKTAIKVSSFLPKEYGPLVAKLAKTESGRMRSTIVDLGNKYATTEADIMNMATNLASAGTQVGMSESDILALATALSSVGMEAQAGGTAFSKALVEMQLAVETNSDSLKDWADVAGMSADEFSTLFREDATGALEAFIAGLSNCGGETDSAIKVLDDMGITETRMRDALLRSANASDVFTSAIQTGKTAWEENNALTEEANKRYETTKSKLEIMGNNLKDIGITFGSTFLPMITQGTEKVKEFSDKIADLDPWQQKAILGIVGFVAILSPLLIGIGKVSTGLSAMIGFGSKITGMFAGIGTAAEGAGAAAAGGAGVALGPLLLVIAAIAAITATIAVLWQKSESFRDFATGLFDIFKNTISGFLESLGISEKIEEIKQTLSGFEEKIVGLDNFFEVLGTILAVIIVPALVGVAAGFGLLLNIINPILTIIGGLIDQLSGLGTFIVGVFTGDMDMAYQGLQTWMSGVGQTFSGLWNLVVGGLNGFLSGLVNFFTSLLHACGLDSFANGVQNTFESIKSGISTKINAARDTVKSAIEKIKSFFNFTWKLPDLKLPHFSITGSFSLNPPSVPKLGIEWYAKGAVFKKATILPTYSGYKGVGEAGEEAVAPITLLRSYVEDSVESALMRLQKVKEDPIDYERLADEMAKRKVIVQYNSREFGRIIEEVTE